MANLLHADCRCREYDRESKDQCPVPPEAHRLPRWAKRDNGTEAEKE